MNFILIGTVITFFILFFAGEKCATSESKNLHNFRLYIVFFTVAFLIRILCAGIFYGHKTDMSCFVSWADMLYRDGLSSFYTSESFTDYPPGYMYILWILGFIKNTFSLNGTAEIILIKLPAICADMLSAIIIYNYLKRKRNKNASLLSALFLFNPAIILNSSVWGQVDSIMTLFVILAVILISEQKVYFSYLFFAIAVFIKPQAFIITPIIIYATGEKVIKNFSLYEIVKFLRMVLISLIIIFIFSLPFGIKEVLAQYIKTLSSYSYASVNAFNLWTAMGKNWVELSAEMIKIGTILLAFITFLAFYILFFTKSKTKYFYTVAFLFFGAYILGVKMHERYAYPAIVFMLISFFAGGDKKHSTAYALISASQFFNTAYILFVYETNPALYYNSTIVIAASFINLGIYLYIAYLSDKIDMPYLFSKKINKPKLEKSLFLKLRKKDYIFMGIITFVYAMTAFSNLGDIKVPKTEYILKKGEELKIEFNSNENLEYIMYYTGFCPLDENNTLTIIAKDSNEEQVNVVIENDAQVFSWNTTDIPAKNVKTITFIADEDFSVNELAFYAENGVKIIVKNSEEYCELFDEHYLIPVQKTYMNSTYFDEIYHARTAYEFIHKLPVYEWTHPPLGKFLISLGIRIFGMNPFGWRFMGALFGVLMIPLIYIMAKLLFQNTLIAFFSASLYSLDFMHYTQTRIATIDVFVTFFIMLAYFFMFEYANRNFYKNTLKQTLIPLFFSGISIGLSIACKWTGIYAGLGLAIIFFSVLIRRFKEYRYAKKNILNNSEIISSKIIEKQFKGYLFKTLAFSFVFFVIIPVLIYILSYIPYIIANGEGVAGIIKNQIDIFEYHSKTVVESTHPYSSKWYTWPFMLRPMWYYSNSFLNGLKAGISAFGNPAIWWGGVLATIFCLIYVIQKKDKTTFILVIAYASNYLPWIFVERTTFIYHYFPAVPFVVLMIAYSFNQLLNKYYFAKRVIFGYIGLAAILFVLFYPVITGLPANAEFVTKFLRWLPGWVLI